MDGILIINKEKGCTSHDIVYKVKKILNERVGHTGTLDPMAEGVLPLLIGKGTLCSKYLINHDKTYIVNLQLGKKTDTADTEGNIIEQKDVKEQVLEQQNIIQTLQEFIGKQKQIPPMYSAIKVNGKKLYEYARKGEKIEIEPRTIEIYDIKLIEIDKNLKSIKFEVSCSKGTYIRSLCEDIAQKLETVGHMSELKRIQVGEFNIKEAINIKELTKAIEQNQPIRNKIKTIEQIFSQNEKIILSEKDIKLLLNGVKITNQNKDGVYKIYNQQNEFIGLATINNNKLKRDIIINE